MNFCDYRQRFGMGGRNGMANDENPEPACSGWNCQLMKYPKPPPM